MKQTIFSGYGSYRKLSSILEKFSADKIFLVTGKRSYAFSGAQVRLRPILKQWATVRFNHFQANPDFHDLKKGIDCFLKSGCDMVVGIGGGSVLDMAKAVSLFATQPRKLIQFSQGKTVIHKRKIPSVIIPTTAGTGSESSRYSVFNIGKSKYSLTHNELIPDYAILDPTFTLTLPRYLTACTGMDALCQAIEAYWSVNSTLASRGYSRRAIRLIMSNLDQCVNKPSLQSRAKMLLASNLAGKAINIAQTTAAHAVSYPMTTYFNIAHGHAVALTLSSFIEFNDEISSVNVQDKRGYLFVLQRMKELLKLLKVSNAYEARIKIENLMRQIHLETRLSKLGITRQGLEIIVKNGFSPQRIKNNPRIVCEEDLRSILIEIL